MCVSDRQRLSQGTHFLSSLLLTGRSAFIGIGFTDRGDAFDFNVSLQDHFKWVKQETEISKESQEMDNRPKLDLGFKEGLWRCLEAAVAASPRFAVLLLWKQRAGALAPWAPRGWPRPGGGMWCAQCAGPSGREAAGLERVSCPVLRGMVLGAARAGGGLGGRNALLIWNAHVSWRLAVRLPTFYSVA